MARKPIQVPGWFKAVAIAALVWNLLGVAAWFYQSFLITPAMLMEMPEAQRALLEHVPPWVDWAYGIAVFGGFIGSFLLIIRSALAVPVFAVSLAAVAVQMFHAFVMSKALEVYGAAGVALPVLIIVIAVYLLMVAGQARHQGWID
ncbi:hypothetical protein F3N42_14220 [Marinihelvus fidelis]|uniref:Sugar transporter n=1 Tax=Marinihelvus fidelis TaxID=2613842 RepID=A0A5N0T408_9GAMM|nr:hypothetical protein [Marinihelvus fidelis]KAA9129805.1 hypothetical protein F3N42_14220 [Marinihelvus fidelis]